MAKVSGLGMTLTVQDSGLVARDITNDVTDLTLDMPFATQDTTGLDKSAHERLALLADTKLTAKGVHNNASNRIHPVISTGQTTPRQTVITFTGGAGATLTFTGLLSDYKLTRAANGSLVPDFTQELSNGVVGAWS